MPEKIWTLLDIDRDAWVEELHVRPRDCGYNGPENFEVRKRVLRGGLRDGLNVVEINNGVLQFTVLADRGMGLWRGRRGDIEIGWNSPLAGPVHPRHVPVDDPSGIGWLWGFDEWLCRCGLASNGAPEFDAGGRLLYPLHGRIANLPARRLELGIDQEQRTIRVTGVVDEARMFGPKLRLTSTVTTVLGSAELRIVDEVTNLSAEPGEMQLLYHVNLGWPLLAPGSRVVAAVDELAPRDEAAIGDLETWDRYGPEEPGRAEMVHYMKLAAAADGWTHVLLANERGDRGVSLGFDTRTLPCFTFWKCPQGQKDGYVTGLEPGTGYPNVRSFEKREGRVVSLAPGETRRFELSFAAHATAAEVDALEQSIRDLAPADRSKKHEKPQRGWSPAGD